MRLKKWQVWCENNLELNGCRNPKLWNSISQEELLRLKFMDVLDVDGLFSDYRKRCPVTYIRVRG